MRLIRSSGFTFVMLVLTLSIAQSNAMDAKRTVIPGTHSWDVDCNCIKKGKTADFRLDHFDAKLRKLQPLNDARLSLVVGRKYDQVDLDFAGAQNLDQIILTGHSPNDFLAPGTVIVFQTTEGQYGKMEIIGWHNSHDFSFPEASILSEKLREHMKNKPVKEKYHLEVKWQLLPG